ncbi:5'-3' exonuclease domain-containing protein [Planoprotostelium fungivorum]|uniref:3'-5' exonuclease n=1 Tax=Planoprotostelium fungivorum TaxID=1890364 RepID=A0A2P6MTN8_9EUKA|nr:5'-3' exonuclease domain-containing protein [Planoprotostelium fungivorum]
MSALDKLTEELRQKAAERFISVETFPGTALRDSITIALCEDDHFRDGFLRHYLSAFYALEHGTPSDKEKRHLVLGFDCEFSRHGVVELIQFSTNHLIVLVQVGLLGTVPEEVIELLEDDQVILSGVGCINDSFFIQQSFPQLMIRPRSFFEISNVTWSNAISKALDLNQLSDLILGVEKSELKKKSADPWKARFMDKGNIEYAARDAWLGYNLCRKLYLTLTAQNKSSKKKESLYEWSAARIATVEQNKKTRAESIERAAMEAEAEREQLGRIDASSINPAAESVDDVIEQMRKRAATTTEDDKDKKKKKENEE